MYNKKVLFILEFDPRRILTQRIHHLLEYLRSNFHEVHVTYLDNKVRFKRDFFLKNDLDNNLEFAEGNVYYFVMPDCQFPDNDKRFKLNRIIMKRSLINKFKDAEFDLCIICFPLCGFLMHEIKKFNIAKIILYEDVDDFVDLYQRNTLEHSGEMVKNFKLFEDYSLLNADVVFSISESLREYRKEQNTLNKHHFISPNGVIFDLFKPQSLTQRENVAVFMGILEEWAGVHYAIKGFKEALDMGGDGKFYIIGSGPYEKQLKELVGRLGLDHRVKFFGKLDHKKLPEVLHKAKVGIITFEEANATKVAHPVKLIEYFAAGLAVIGSDFGEISKAIYESKAGIAVSNTKEFALALNRIFTEENFFRECEKNAIDYAREFDWEKILQKQFEVALGIVPKRVIEKLKLDYSETLEDFINLLQSNFNLDSLFEKLEKGWLSRGFRRIFIYGSGEHTKLLLKRWSFTGLNLEGIIDSNPEVWGQERFGYKIMSFHEAMEHSPDLIIISSRASEKEIYKSIKDECLEKGVEVYRLYADNLGLEDLIWRDLYID